MEIFLDNAEKKIVADARSFVEKEIRPYAAEFDRKEALPCSLIKKLAAKGYLAARFPEEYGGLDLDPLTYGLLTEEIGKGCTNVRSLLTVQVSMVGESILKWGTKKQIEKWLPLMAKGEKIAAFALTEPEFGSDAKSVQTSFKKEGDNFVISGEKKWISFAGIADLFLVVAKSEDKMAAIIVEKERKGVEVLPMGGLLGCRASHIAEIKFRNVSVPQENLLGEIEPGLNKVVSFALDQGRYSIAWGSVAIAQAALEAMVKYARKRVQFGEKIRHFQLIQEFISEAVAKTHASRTLCLRAAQLRQKGHLEAVVATSIAKYFSSRAAMEIAMNAVQVHGGDGCWDRYPAERLFREAKILEIIEGTSQIHQQIIASYGIAQYSGGKA